MNNGISDLDLLYISDSISLNCDLLQLKDCCILLTGATGFFGKWILTTIQYLNSTLDLNITVTTITRNKFKFLKDFPIFIDPKINIHEGQLENYQSSESFNYIIHTAANVITSSDCLDIENYHKSSQEITSNIIQHLKGEKLRKFLYTSSGAVYGNLKIGSAIPDESLSLNKNNATAYALAKIEAEEVFTNFCLDNNVEYNIARCFSFIGPYLPLNSSYAAGNFISNAMSKSDILIRGNGESLRSFMYMSDLTISLFNLLLTKTKSNVYNIGSTEAISIKTLASKIASFGDCKATVLNELPENYVSQYLPNCDLYFSQFKHKPLSFDEALLKTMKWHLDSHLC